MSSVFRIWMVNECEMVYELFSSEDVAIEWLRSREWVDQLSDEVDVLLDDGVIVIEEIEVL